MLILNKLWGYVIGAAAVIIALAAAFFGIRRSGEKAAEAEATEKAFDQAKEANAIDKTVRADSDDDVARELRKYQRD